MCLAWPTPARRDSRGRRPRPLSFIPRSARWLGYCGVQCALCAAHGSRQVGAPGHLAHHDAVAAPLHGATRHAAGSAVPAAHPVDDADQACLAPVASSNPAVPCRHRLRRGDPVTEVCAELDAAPPEVLVVEEPARAGWGALAAPQPHAAAAGAGPLSHRGGRAPVKTGRPGRAA